MNATPIDQIILSVDGVRVPFKIEGDETRHFGPGDSLLFDGVHPGGTGFLVQRNPVEQYLLAEHQSRARYTSAALRQGGESGDTTDSRATAS